MTDVVARWNKKALNNWLKSSTQDTTSQDFSVLCHNTVQLLKSYKCEEYYMLFIKSSREKAA